MSVETFTIVNSRVRASHSVNFSPKFWLTPFYVVSIIMFTVSHHVYEGHTDQMHHYKVDSSPVIAITFCQVSLLPTGVSFAT